MLFFMCGQIESFKPSTFRVSFRFFHQTSPVTFASLQFGNYHGFDKKAAVRADDAGYSHMSEQFFGLFAALKENETDGEFGGGFLEALDTSGLTALPFRVH